MATSKTIRITGRVLDENGAPMVFAQVHVGSFKIKRALCDYQVQDDGSFAITLKCKTLYKLQFTGVGHNMFEFPFISPPTKGTNLIVHLQSYQYYDTLRSVQILCDLDNFTHPFTMKKSGEVFCFDTVLIKTQDTFSYQVTGLEKTAANHSINGTQSDYYSYDNDGDYLSIVKLYNKEIHIIFDPRKLLRNISDFSILSTPISIKRIALAYHAVRSMKKKFTLWQSINPGKGMEEFQNVFPEQTAHLIQIENNRTAQQILLLSYIEFCLPEIYGKAKYSKGEIISQLLKTVPQNSELWQIFPPYLPAIIPGICKNSQMSIDYTDRVIAQQGDSSIRIELLNNLIQLEAFVSDSTLKYKYLNMLKYYYPYNPITLKDWKSYSGIIIEEIWEKVV